MIRVEDNMQITLHTLKDMPIITLGSILPIKFIEYTKIMECGHICKKIQALSFLTGVHTNKAFICCCCASEYPAEMCNLCIHRPPAWE